MINGNIFTIAGTNAEKFGTLLQQLGGLIGSRADLEDICVSSRVNKWAARKAFPRFHANYEPVKSNSYTEARIYVNSYTGQSMTRIGDIGNVEVVGRPEVILDGAGFYTAMGFDIPVVDSVNSEDSNSLNRVVGVIKRVTNNESGLNWEKSLWNRREGAMNLIKDFNGYNHKAAFPFAYEIDMTEAYIDNGPHITVNHVSSNDNISLETLFNVAFGGGLKLALIIENPAGGYALATGTSISSASSSCAVPESVKTSYHGGIPAYANKYFKAYICAYDENKKKAIILPMGSGQSPLKTFKVNGYLYADPFVHLDMVTIAESGSGSEINPDFNETIKAGRNGKSWAMKTFVPTLDTRTYHALPTSGDVVMSFTVKNIKGESLAIDLSKISGKITVNTGTELNEHITLYDANLNALSGTITLAANESRTFYIYQSSIFGRFGIPSTAQSDTLIRTIVISLYYNDGRYGSYPPDGYPKMGTISAMLVYTTAHSSEAAIVSNPNGYDYTITGWTSNI